MNSYIEHFLILASAVIECISISAFASLLGIPIWIMTCAMTAGIKKYKSIMKKQKKKHDKIVLLAKSKLEVLTSKYFNWFKY